MFDRRVVKSIAKDNKEVLKRLGEIQEALNARFWQMDDTILALLLSVATNEPLLLIGKPGTAKSRLIRAFCETVGLINEQDSTQNGPLAKHLARLEQRDKGQAVATGYFEYLLTPFTEPNELFGFYNIEDFLQPGTSSAGGRLERIEKDMMQNAYVIYLDEVFNASSAILNSLLTFLNERMFHDRGKRNHVRYRALFAATNKVPESAELAAVYDRFLFRCRVENANANKETIQPFLEKGWQETYGRSMEKQFPGYPTRPRSTMSSASKDYDKYLDLFPNLVKLRNDLRRCSLDTLIPRPTDKGAGFFHEMINKIATARSSGMSDMSNRRVIKMLHAMLIHCMFRTVNGQGGQDYQLDNKEIELMDKFFYDRVYKPEIWK
jgi:MoxR-like ATPase